MKHLKSYCSALFLLAIVFQTTAYAGKNKDANPVSNTRAHTAAKAQAALENKKVTTPDKGGYHVGKDTRYQPSKKDGTYTKHSGGKDSSGSYKKSEKR